MILHEQALRSTLQQMIKNPGDWLEDEKDKPACKTIRKLAAVAGAALDVASGLSKVDILDEVLNDVERS